jgi:hypothetical protein
MAKLKAVPLFSQLPTSLLKDLIVLLAVYSTIGVVGRGN